MQHIVNHPSYRNEIKYYKIVIINDRYWLSGMCGEIRSCPQNWAKQNYIIGETDIENSVRNNRKFR